MLPSLERICQQPEYYLEQALEGDLDLLSVYGPYLYMHTTPLSEVSIPRIQIGVEQALLTGAKFLRAHESKRKTYSESKKAILQEMAYVIPRNRLANPSEQVIADLCEGTMEQYRKEQYEKRLMEGVMIDTAPISPYAGTLRKVMDSEEPKEYKKKPLAFRKTYRSLAELIARLERPHPIEEAQALLLDHLLPILREASEGLLLAPSEHDLPDQLPSGFLRFVAQEETSIHYPLVYAGLSYIQSLERNSSDPEIASSFIEQVLIPLGNTAYSLTRESCALEDSIHVLEQFLSGEENRYDDPDWEAEQRYQQQMALESTLEEASREMEQFILDHPETQAESYDINALMNYIYQHIQYGSNGAVRSFQLNPGHQGQFLMEMNDYVIYEIDGKYLGIPIMDHKDQSVKMVTIDKEGTIDMHSDLFHLA